MDINNYLGLTDINESILDILKKDLRKYYKISSDISVYSCNLDLLAYNSENKQLNNRHRLLRIIKKKYKILNTGIVYKGLLSYKNKRYYKNIFIKEISMLPLKFNSFKLISDSNYQSHQIFKQLYSTNSPPNIELLTTYLTSKLFELSISPSFCKLYGYFYTTFKKFTYCLDNDMSNIEGKIYKKNTDTFIVKNNVPVLLLAIEKIDFDFPTLQRLTYVSIEFYKSICFQVFIAVFNMYTIFGIQHNDLHIGNILFNTTEEEYLYYNFNNTYYKVPTFGFIIKIIDWGRGVYKYNNYIGKNEIFAPLHDCENQLIYNRFNKSPRKNSKWTDIVIFVQNMLYNYPDIKKHLDFYTFLKKLLKTNKGYYISTKKFNWEIYNTISKNIFNIRPLNILKHTLFKKYIIKEKPDSSIIYPILL